MFLTEWLSRIVSHGGKGGQDVPSHQLVIGDGPPSGKAGPYGGGGQRGLGTGAMPSEGQSCEASAAHQQLVMVFWPQGRTFLEHHRLSWAFPGGTEVKNLPASAGDNKRCGLIPGSGRSPGGGNGNPLQYSCLKNSTGRGAQSATVHGGWGGPQGIQHN